MNAKALYPAIALFGFVFLGSQALAVPVTIPPLGTAGGWAVLDIGSNGNVSIASPGSIAGNVGVNGGSLSDSGTPITGNVVYSSSATVNPNVAANVSGTISQNSLAQAVIDAAAASSAATSLGYGVPVSSINFSNAGSIALSAAPGTNQVYNLTSLVLNGTTLRLTPGANYVFNISSALALSSSQILDSTPADVLFSITGTQGAALSGGSVLDGIVLAPHAGFSESGGSVVGEIISGGNISLSGAKIVDAPTVPDSGSSFSVKHRYRLFVRWAFRRSLAS